MIFHKDARQTQLGGTVIVEGYSPGEAAAAIQLQMVPPFAPLVCYEMVYPRRAARAVPPGSD